MLRIDRKLVFLDIEATSLDTLTARPWEIAMIERWPSGRERATLMMVSDVDISDASEESLRVGGFNERHAQGGRAKWHEEKIAALWIARRLAKEPGLGLPVVVGSNVAGYDLPIITAMLARHARFIARAGAVPAWHHHPVDLVTWTQAREAQSPFGTIALSTGSYELSELAGVPRPAGAVAHTAMGDALWARDWWDAIKGVTA
ncbi:MAG: hypothetical protein ACTIA5_01605 [Brachybacterium tyrofermentans]